MIENIRCGSDQRFRCGSVLFNKLPLNNLMYIYRLLLSRRVLMSSPLIAWPTQIATIFLRACRGVYSDSKESWKQSVYWYYNYNHNPKKWPMNRSVFNSWTDFPVFMILLFYMASWSAGHRTDCLSDSTSDQLWMHQAHARLFCHVSRERILILRLIPSFQGIPIPRNKKVIGDP